MKLYVLRLLHAMEEDEPDRPFEFYERFLHMCDGSVPFLDLIICPDEATYKLNGNVNQHNCVFWSDENP
jgi:hypothetical protein